MLASPQGRLSGRPFCCDGRAFAPSRAVNRAAWAGRLSLAGRALARRIVQNRREISNVVEFTTVLHDSAPVEAVGRGARWAVGRWAAGRGWAGGAAGRGAGAHGGPRDGAQWGWGREGAGGASGAAPARPALLRRGDAAVGAGCVVHAPWRVRHSSARCITRAHAPYWQL